MPFTLNEIKSHNTKGSAWICIHNRVYDVTHFLQEHPGGEEVLLDVLGKNATGSFEEVGHSNESRDLMAKYLLGDLVETDKTVWIDKKEIRTERENLENSSSSIGFFGKALIGTFAIGIIYYLL